VLRVTSNVIPGSLQETPDAAPPCGCELPIPSLQGPREASTPLGMTSSWWFLFAPAVYLDAVPELG
jgi:hypothetical protein